MYLYPTCEVKHARSRYSQHSLSTCRISARRTHLEDRTHVCRGAASISFEHRSSTHASSCPIQCSPCSVAHRVSWDSRAYCGRGTSSSNRLGHSLCRRHRLSPGSVWVPRESKLRARRPSLLLRAEVATEVKSFFRRSSMLVIINPYVPPIYTSSKSAP